MRQGEQSSEEGDALGVGLEDARPLLPVGGLEGGGVLCVFGGRVGGVGGRCGEGRLCMRVGEQGLGESMRCVEGRLCIGRGSITSGATRSASGSWSTSCRARSSADRPPALLVVLVVVVAVAGCVLLVLVVLAAGGLGFFDFITAPPTPPGPDGGMKVTGRLLRFLPMARSILSVFLCCGKWVGMV